uniref:Glycosyltransferase 2-like domain-containing protein n=1 Tax=viral metagenome TaxID=1070528 RepID=A0A6C0DPF4_9ZZZZ
MTVINGIEIDDIHYKINDIKYAISNNDPIEDKLNVIIVISNPCMYARRYILLKEFVKRMEEEEDHVRVFIVELIYKDQRFIITDKKNKNHLQLKTDVPIWHKENMINLGVKHLLPKKYKAFAWVDADIEFDSSTWAIDTLKILNGCKDVVQLYSHSIDLNHDNRNLNIFNSFGYSFNKNKSYTSRGIDYWHPGYAWAITRKAYEKIGGLYDKGILGSGDNVMAMAFINKAEYMTNEGYDDDYNNSMLEYQVKASKLRLGYTPGVIRHHFHGTKQNRKYKERWQILMNHKYSPNKHLTYDNNGILVPTNDCPVELLDDIVTYFRERKEDTN